MRRRPAMWIILLSVGGALLFVGCLQWDEVTRWRREPELTVKAPPDRLIRVRLGNGARKTATLEITSGFNIRPTFAGRVLVEDHAALRAVAVRAAPGGGIDLGEEHLTADDIILTPKRDASVVLDQQTYRGALRILRQPEGLIFDNHVDVESYLRGVLRGELPRDFHAESFKTLAVAARTYVLYQKQTAAADRGFDVYDHEGSQMYIGVRGEDRIAVDAVEKTKGEVCVWNDGRGAQLFCTYYSSTCGGLSQPVNNVKTNVVPIPPLAGNVPCQDCYLAKFYRWDPVELSKSEVTKRLVARYPTLTRLGTITELEPKARTPDGRIIRLLLIGANGQNETLVGEDFRLCLGGRVLKSTNFEIETRDKTFLFKNGKGFGHGIGLCQYGMETKARRGLGYRPILQIYYPRSEIKKLY